MNSFGEKTFAHELILFDCVRQPHVFAAHKILTFYFDVSIKDYESHSDREKENKIEYKRLSFFKVVYSKGIECVRATQAY